MSSETSKTADELLSDALAGLQKELGLLDLLGRQGSSGRMELLVMRLDRIELRIDGAANHGRPHFHVTLTGKFSASFSIDTFSCLAGTVPSKYEKQVLNWARNNQDLLYQKWQDTHPGAKVFALVHKGTES